MCRVVDIVLFIFSLGACTACDGDCREGERLLAEPGREEEAIALIAEDCSPDDAARICRDAWRRKIGGAGVIPDQTEAVLAGMAVNAGCLVGVFPTSDALGIAISPTMLDRAMQSASDGGGGVKPYIKLKLGDAQPPSLPANAVQGPPCAHPDERIIVNLPGGGQVEFCSEITRLQREKERRLAARNASPR